MASEMRRIAKALVQSRRESFASRYSRGESVARLARALEGFAPRRTRIATAWHEDAGGLHLDVSFAPAARVDLILKVTSLVLVLLIGATAWAFLSRGEDDVVKFVVALTCVLGMLAFPIVAVALGSQREAEEATLSRVLKRALVDEENPRATDAAAPVAGRSR